MRWTIKYTYGSEVKEISKDFINMENPTFIKFKNGEDWVYLPWSNIVLLLDSGYKSVSNGNSQKL